MDSRIVSGRILQKFIDKGFAQVDGYNKFGFVELKNTSVIVSRENGLDTSIPLRKLIAAIDAYQKDIELYDEGPNALRDCGIAHITSPIFALLHILDKDDFGIS